MDPKCEYSQIVIPIDLKYLKIASQYTGSVAEKFGLNKQTVDQIMAVTKQALSWVIDYSFEETDRGFIDISCEIVPEGFKITIKDKGLPLDPSRMKNETSDQWPEARLLKEGMDDVRFNNLGPQGKEIILIKHVDQSRITDYYQSCELDFYGDAPKIKPTPPEKITHTVRPLKPGEEIEVSKCIYKGYGRTYSHSYVYYPEKLAELNKNRLLFSVVAVTETNEIAGHCALRYEHANGSLAEIGLGVVKPEFRSQGCMNRMVEFLIEKAKADGLLGVYSQAITAHTHSQQVAARYNAVECAALIGAIADTVRFKGGKKTPSQRGSVMTYFIYFNQPSQWNIYPPAKHKAMIQRLYDQLKMTPHIKHLPESGLKDANNNLDDESVIQINIMKSVDFAQIKIETYGKGIIDEIKKIIRDLCLKKISAITIHINLSDPITPWFSEKIEEMGCFFAGILPGSMPDKGDALIFQYLNNVDMDYEKIKCHSPHAKRLLDYIQRHDPNEMGI